MAVHVKKQKAFAKKTIKNSDAGEKCEDPSFFLVN